MKEFNYIGTALNAHSLLKFKTTVRAIFACVTTTVAHASGGAPAPQPVTDAQWSSAYQFFLFFFFNVLFIWNWNISTYVVSYYFWVSYWFVSGSPLETRYEQTVWYRLDINLWLLKWSESLCIVIICIQLILFLIRANCIYTTL